MKRNEDGDLHKINPFVIGKSLEQAAGVMKEAKKLRDGTILLETTGKKQTEKVLRLKHLSNVERTPVTIYDHPTLNTCKGIAFADDFEFLNEEEIKNGLLSQGVVAVKQLTKFQNEQRVPTRGAIITFDLPTLPKHIKIGYYRVGVKLYVPNPLRCRNCHIYNHHESKCRKLKEKPPIKLCGNCGENSLTKGHAEDEKQKISCINSSKCIHCSDRHAVWNRQCPKYLEELEIQKIKISNKITFREARKIYTNHHTNEIFQTNKITNQTYAQITRQQPEQNQQPKQQEHQLLQKNQQQQEHKPQQEHQQPTSSNNLQSSTKQQQTSETTNINQISDDESDKSTTEEFARIIFADTTPTLNTLSLPTSRDDSDTPMSTI